MKYFIDSANVESIKKVIEYFPVSGVTTNPSIIAREQTEFLPLIKEIRRITSGLLLFVQVTAEKASGMVEEAKMLKNELGGDICIKIPATKEGVKAVKQLSVEGVPTAAPAVYSVQQALMCAAAGAEYVAPYLSHIDNMSIDSVETAGKMAELFARYYPSSHVLAASFRVAEQINRVILAGVDAVTLTPEMFDTLISNKMTESELDSFRSKWNGVYGDKTVKDFF